MSAPGLKGKQTIIICETTFPWGFLFFYL